MTEYIENGVFERWNVSIFLKCWNHIMDFIAGITISEVILGKDQLLVKGGYKLESIDAGNHRNYCGGYYLVFACS